MRAMRHLTVVSPRNTIISGWEGGWLFVEAPYMEVLNKTKQTNTHAQKNNMTTKQASSEMLSYIGKNYVNR